jgi:hypothetical protein
MIASENVSRNDELEFKKLELEKQRIQLEQKKLEIERSKARWTSVSILVPLLVIAVTVGLNIWSQNQQARSDFEIKAAEIVLSADKPSEASAKAKALQDLFPDRLPENFAESFQTEVYSGPSAAPRTEILHLIVEHPDYKQEIIDMWRQLFPSHAWVENLR